MTNSTIPNVPRELPTPYELATYEGRKLDDSRSDGYCGSCPIETHIAQLKDPKSWVHSCVKVWERLGGLHNESAPSPAGVDGLEVAAWRIGLPNNAGYKVYEQRQPWAYEQYGAPSVIVYEVQELCRLTDAQAIIDGLRGEVAVALKVPSVAAMHAYLDTECAKDNMRLGAERDQQAQRIGKLVEVLRIAGGAIKEICTERNVPLPSSTLRRIDAALSAGKEKQDERS